MAKNGESPIAIIADSIKTKTCHVERSQTTKLHAVKFCQLLSPFSQNRVSNFPDYRKFFGSFLPNRPDARLWFPLLSQPAALCGKGTEGARLFAFQLET